MRHNEDVLNGELSRKLPWAVGTEELDSPHVKAHLLLQVCLGLGCDVMRIHLRKDAYRSLREEK